MSQNGSPYENAVAERVNGILKHELGLIEEFKSFGIAQEQVEKAVHIYNNLRPHSSCNYLTPEQAHSTEGRLTKLWKNYYTKGGPAVNVF